MLVRARSCSGRGATNLRTEGGQPCSGETFILVDPPMPVKTGTVGRSLGNVVSDPLGIRFGAVH